MRKILLIMLFAAVGAATLHAQKKTFVRDYTYQASELDSKVTARANATTQMRNILLREVGEFLHTERTIKLTATSQDYAEKTEAITASIIEMKTLDEQWDGFIYYIKAEMTVDPKDLERRIVEVLNDKQKTKELEESRKRTLAAEAEAARLIKELKESKDRQQRLALQKTYTQATDALSAEEYFTRGYNAGANGFYELAIEYYQQSIAANPNYALAYCNMGYAYNNLQDYREAIRYYEKAIAIDPNFSLAYHRLGYVYYGLGDHQQALIWIKKAIEVDNDYINGYDSLGEIYERMGNRKKAVENYQIAARRGYKNSQKWLQENGYRW